jgi:hypothetical protein
MTESTVRCLPVERLHSTGDRSVSIREMLTAFFDPTHKAP